MIRIDKELNKRYETLIEQYKESRNITEELKEQDQMRWVQEMNNIRVSVAEMLIYETKNLWVKLKWEIMLELIRNTCILFKEEVFKENVYIILHMY